MLVPKNNYFDDEISTLIFVNTCSVYLSNNSVMITFYFAMIKMKTKRYSRIIVGGENSFGG